MDKSAFAARLRAAPLLLDGATGTELERRGYRTAMPLWTALSVREAGPLLRAVHGDYVQAGADILTACTFRTTRHTLAKAGLGAEARALTIEAVSAARECARAVDRTVLVAGSMAPLEDCYNPALTQPEETLAREHALHAHNLAEAGCDLLLIETMPTAREASAAVRAASQTGLPVILSLLAGPHATLYDGSQLKAAIDAAVLDCVMLVTVNCAPPAWCSQAMPVLSACGLPFGAYANSSIPDGSFGSVPKPIAVGSFASQARSWLEQGARLIGGCCGTTDAHIAALRTVIQHTEGA